MRKVSVSWATALFVIALSEITFAQMSTGTISGTVSDATGAVIPGAAVTVKNVDTGVSRSLTTNAQGRYVVPQLSPGDYEVTTTASGFQTEVRRGITLAVGLEWVCGST